MCTIEHPGILVREVQEKERIRHCDLGLVLP
jgi:hypothetical protein